MSNRRGWVSVLAGTVALTFALSGCNTGNGSPAITSPVPSQATGNQVGVTGANSAGNTTNGTGNTTGTGNTANSVGNTNNVGSTNSTGNTANSTDPAFPNSQTGNAVSTQTNPSPPPPAQNLVPYTGPFQHIFFHPLIAFPSVTFNPKDPELKGFNDYFVTVNEFGKMLSLLYQRNYILVNINSLYTETTANGKTYVHKKTLMLPKGKIPLVLSIDDMNYYPYMQEWGTVQKLVLDANGNVAALSRFPDGHTAITYDNAIVPILDSFVQQHPDFSFDGAKGMINLTGYAGVLGYRTNDTTAPDYAQAKAQAEQVIARLKSTGWYFASHGWGHLDDANISYQTFVADTNKWMQQVEPLIGPTEVYVYPFGSRVETDGSKFDYLIKEGFHVFCGVGPTTYVQWSPEVLMMDRRHMDGIALALQRKDLNDLFGNADLLDPVRPNTY